MRVIRAALEDLIAKGDRDKGEKGKKTKKRKERGGLLLGRKGTILKVVSGPNHASDPTMAFEPPASWLVATFKGARAEGFEVIASFHSHPEGGGRPSAVDRETLAGGLPMVIVDEVRGEAHLWREGDRGINEVSLVVVVEDGDLPARGRSESREPWFI